MSLRRSLLALLCVVIIWASRDSSAIAQPVPPPPTFLTRSSPKERAIEYRLRQPISLNFKDVPLREAVDAIKVQSGIQVVLDLRALQAARVNLDAPLTISVEDIDMKFALNILLKPLSLAYVIEDDVLKVTTEDRSICKLVRKTYPISDLLVPLPMVEGQEQPKSNLEEPLMKLITDTVVKNSWEVNGGHATIQYFPMGKAIVVNQCQECHEEVALLLATLRKLNDLTVGLEVRFVHASENSARQIRKVMKLHGDVVTAYHQPPREPSTSFVNRPGLPAMIECADPGKGKRAFISLDDQHLRKVLELAQSDRAASIIQAPKLNVWNLQSFPFECTKKKVATTEFRTSIPKSGKDEAKDYVTALTKVEEIVSGWRCSLWPVVSPDRRSVRLSLSVEHFANDDAKSVERITKASKTFNLPDGRTLVWDLGATDGQHLFVLVTPRVAVRQEPKEEIFLGEQTPIPGR